MRNILSFVGIALCLVTLVFSTCALTINLWQVYDDSSTTIKTGLFQVCVERRGLSESCRSLDDFVEDERRTNLETVRCTIYVAIVLLVTSFICAVLNITKMKTSKRAGYMASCFAFIAGVFLFISFAYYSWTLHKHDYDYHVTFALTVIGWMFSWAASALFFSEKYLTRD